MKPPHTPLLFCLLLAAFTLSSCQNDYEAERKSRQAKWAGMDARDKAKAAGKSDAAANQAANAAENAFWKNEGAEFAGTLINVGDAAARIAAAANAAHPSTPAAPMAPSAAAAPATTVCPPTHMH